MSTMSNLHTVLAAGEQATFQQAFLAINQQRAELVELRGELLDLGDAGAPPFFYVVVSTISDGMPPMRSRKIGDSRLAYGFANGDVVFGSQAFCKSLIERYAHHSPLPCDTVAVGAWLDKRQEYLTSLMLKLSAASTEMSLLTMTDFPE